MKNLFIVPYLTTFTQVIAQACQDSMITHFSNVLRRDIVNHHQHKGSLHLSCSFNHKCFSYWRMTHANWWDTIHHSNTSWSEKKNTLTCKIYYICIVDNHAIVLMNVQKFVANRQHEHVSLLLPIQILKN